jgi:2-isopropylmalate synthase
MEKIGANMVLLDDTLFSGAGVRMTTRIVKGVVDEPEDYVELHSHEVDQIFIYLGDADNEESLEVEFRFEEEVYRIKSPTTVFVPKGIPHTQKIIRGSGRYITLLKKGTYT